MLIWAYKRAKDLRGMLPIVVPTDSNILIGKWRSHSFYESDVQNFRRKAWLVANKPDIHSEFVPGSENTGTDLLSRPVSGRGMKDTLRPIPEVNHISVWDEIWDEHIKGRWCAKKVFCALCKRRLYRFLEDGKTGLSAM